MTDVTEEILATAPITAPAEPAMSGVNAALPEPAVSAGASSDASPHVEQAPAEDALSLPPSLLETFDKEKAAAPAQAAEGALQEAKPGEGNAPEAASLPPVAYEYALPETLKIDDALKGDIHKAFDAFRADPAKGAQSLVDLHERLRQQDAQNSLAEQYRIFNNTRREWVNEVLSDPQLGGSGHQTAMGAIARMRDQFVSEADRPAFEQFLRVTGAGDHPQFLKLLHNVSRFYDEPPLPPANPKPTPTNGLPPKRGMQSLYNQK